MAMEVDDLQQFLHAHPNDPRASRGRFQALAISNDKKMMSAAQCSHDHLSLSAGGS